MLFFSQLFGMFEKAGMPSFFAHLFSRYLRMDNSLTQPFSEAGHISSTFQVAFDRMLCGILPKNYSSPGFSLRLGSFLQFRNARKPFPLLDRILASSYLVRQPGEGHILDAIYSRHGFTSFIPEFFTYFAELLENPGRSGTGSFDQQRYATAARECLQLYLYSHHIFSMGAAESTLHDKALRRHKPFAWVAQLEVHRRIRKGRNYVNVQQGKKFFNSWFIREYPFSLPKNSPEREHCQSLSYKWALDLLPFLLEKSAISLELAKALRCRTFAMPAQRFPRRMGLAKEAIARYLLRVESVEGNH